MRAQRGLTDEARELAREARSILSGLGAERLLAIVDAELERLEASGGAAGTTSS